MQHRVAITGMGVVSPLGNNVSEVLDALRNGRSGVEFVPERKERGLRSALLGTLKNFVPLKFDREHERHLHDTSRVALTAAMQAVNDAGLTDEQVRNERTGAIVGECSNLGETYQQCYTKDVSKKRLTSLALARTMGSTVSANVNVILGVRGQCYSVMSACASGANAIANGTQLIRLGLQDRVIAGGSQEGSWEFGCLFEALRVFSNREQQPQQASRPFDKNRDGLVPAQGSGFVVLEEFEQARARGARIYGEIIGCGANSDGLNMTTPSGEGGMRCMRLALADADLNPDDIDYINAHATSTDVGDAAEARGIVEVFGNRPFVSSTKSMTGHETAAAGATELIYTLLMMQHGFIAPNINLQEVDPECAGMNIVANQAIDARVNIAMSNSFGFGGVNNVLIVSRPR
jgi:3-oxoacyl-[acyl-carrier-protein] synthase-1